MTPSAVRTGPARVLIIDDHKLFAQAVAAVVGQGEDVHVVGIATTLAEGLAEVRRTAPDVVLLDYRLPDGSGLDGIPLIRKLSPRTAVVMVTAAEDERVLLAAIEAGCSGFVTKTSDVIEIKAAVQRAAAGEASISPVLLARLLNQLARRGTGLGSDLTTREREVLAVLGEGLTNACIAERLQLSVNTVRNYVQSVLVKLGAHSKLEAAAIAVREGIIDPMSRPGVR